MNLRNKDIICRINPQGYIVYVNTCFRDLYGHSKEGIIGKYFLQFVRKDYRKKLLEHFNQQISNNAKSSYIEVPTITKTGREIWVGQNINIFAFGNIL